jgi:hypothetical protein
MATSWVPHILISQTVEVGEADVAIQEPAADVEIRQAAIA